MELTSNWSKGTLFWRIFKWDDTAYWFGQCEGVLSNGETMTYNDQTGSFKMEIKEEGVLGPFVISAGRIFRNDESWTITDNRELGNNIGSISGPGLIDAQQESDFRWCHKCYGLFFSGGQASVGTCPAGGEHEKTDSGNYTLAYGPSAGQSDWRKCYKCKGVFFAGGQVLAGNCPAGDQHLHLRSVINYTLPHNSITAPGQSDWRWCYKCQGLFFSGGHAYAGRCPAGDQHDKSDSGNYTLKHTPNP